MIIFFKKVVPTSIWMFEVCGGSSGGMFSLGLEKGIWNLGEKLRRNILRVHYLPALFLLPVISFSSLHLSTIKIWYCKYCLYRVDSWMYEKGWFHQGMDTKVIEEMNLEKHLDIWRGCWRIKRNQYGQKNDGNIGW